MLAFLAAGALAACSSSRDEGEPAAAGAVSTDPFEEREGDERVVATLALGDLQAGLARLVSMELDVAGVDVDAGEADVIIPARAVDTLVAEGFTVVRSSPVDGRGLESDQSPYQGPKGIEAALHAFAAKYPSLAEVSAIGASSEGRSIWALKIAKDVHTHAPEKPVILFNGMHHAREVTPEVRSTPSRRCSVATASIPTSRAGWTRTRSGSSPLNVGRQPSGVERQPHVAQEHRRPRGG